MTYATLLESEGINAQYLVVIRPARQVSSFTIVSGSVYSQSFDYGYVSKVTQNGVELSAASSTTLAAGEYYWDDENETLYVRMSDSSNPSTKFVVATYEMYFGTLDANWYRIIDDETSKPVYFEPLISKVPNIKASISDIAFGIMPSQKTSITLNNADKILNKHLYDSSFISKDVEVWHWLGDLEVANLSRVLLGRMSDMSCDDTTASINIFDPIDIFNDEFRSQATAFYAASDYPELDPQFEGKPIRYVYGYVDGFVPVNADYLQENPTTSDNRVWKVRADGANSHAVTRTVPASPSSTTTRTYVDSVVGFQVGDTVWIDKASDEYREILVVGANYIEHDALSVAATTGNTVKRGTVSRIEIIQQEVRFLAMYNRDYTESVDVNDVLTFTFTSSLESNLTMGATLSPSDTVFCRVYGKTNNVTLGGPSFGSNNASLGNLTRLTPIFLDILKRFAGVDETEINSTSFTACLSDAVDDIGFAIPESSGDSYPTIKEVLGKLCETSLVKLYQDFDGLWNVSRLKPITTTDKAIDETEIIEGSFDYGIETQDIYSDIVVSFDFREKSATGGEGTGFGLERAESETAKYLHNVNKTLEHKSLHVDRSQAATLALRLSHLFGDRQGKLTFATKNRFFDSVIDDKIELSRYSLIGFEYDKNTIRTRDFLIQEVDKGLRQVTITMADLKGVQDNQGDF